MRIAVIGGGVVGLSVAWGLSPRHDVTVFDPRPGQGASWAAAGMLAPAGEAWHGEESLLRAGLDSVSRWPRFAADLTEASGTDPWLASEGTWMVGATDDDGAEVGRVVSLLRDHGVTTRRVERRDLRSVEPALHPRLRSVVDVPGDLSVHNRRLVRALLQACAAGGVRVVRARADVVVDGGRAAGVRRAGAGGAGDAHTPADVVVLAAGSRLSEVAGAPADVAAACRPVKGQILRLRAPEPLLTRTVRAVVASSPVYLVPRRDGEIVLGATSEEHGYDETVTVDAVHDLLRTGVAVVPGLRDCELTETLARSRPGTPDNAPLVGPTGTPGLLVAGGHYRGGVLLAPLTAAAVEAVVEGTEVPEPALAFSPHRLTGART